MEAKLAAIIFPDVKFSFFFPFLFFLFAGPFNQRYPLGNMNFTFSVCFISIFKRSDHRNNITTGKIEKLNESLIKFNISREWMLPV